jgi:hypothetical protein
LQCFDFLKRISPEKNSEIFRILQSHNKLCLSRDGRSREGYSAVTTITNQAQSVVNQELTKIQPVTFAVTNRHKPIITCFRGMRPSR